MYAWLLKLFSLSNILSSDGTNLNCNLYLVWWLTRCLLLFKKERKSEVTVDWNQHEKSNKKHLSVLSAIGFTRVSTMSPILPHLFLLMYLSSLLLSLLVCTVCQQLLFLHLLMLLWCPDREKTYSFKMYFVFLHIYILKIQLWIMTNICLA